MLWVNSWIGQFMVTWPGRLVRIALSLVLVVIGLAIVGGPVGVVIAVVGLVPGAAGVSDRCVLSPLFGGPFSGQAIRDAGRRQTQVKG
jgi:hypothetical protein